MAESVSKEITIAVMGPTGTGKSTFINLLSGSKLPVGNSMESCTTAVQTSRPFDLDGHRITLIDTPGFDDTSIKDTDVLTMISAYLSFEYKHGRVLTGVIYMHRILDNRMGGISSRNFRMFRNLCGEKSLRNVAIVTNFWEGVDIQVGEAREKELSLKEAFFKPIFDKGARLVRHNPSTLQSAQTILRSFLGQTPQPLQIQCELETGMDITETLAGKELNRELTELIARHRREMLILVNEMNEAGRMRDEETRKELAEDRAKLQTEIRNIQSDASNLAASYAEALAKLQQQMEEKDNATNDPRDIIGESDPQARSGSAFKNLKEHDNAVLEARLGGAFPVFGFGGKLAVMLSPFSLSWK